MKSSFRLSGSSFLCSVLVSLVGPLTGCIDDESTTIPPDQVAFAESNVAAPLGAILANDLVLLGVNPHGNLIVGGGSMSSGLHGTTNVGLRYRPTNAEASATGLRAEGWGVADAVTQVRGHASLDSGGIFNATVVSFGYSSEDPSAMSETAMSVVRVPPMFEVTHYFFPCPAAPQLFEIIVIIQNISTRPAEDLRYTRAIDFDIAPNTYSEFITIGGTTNATHVLYADDNAFQTVNPLGPRNFILGTGDMTDAGPFDHGALIDFDFGYLGAGARRTFRLFYGAAGSEEEAYQALSKIGAEVYAFGQGNWDGTDDPMSKGGAPKGTYGATTGRPATFILAARDVGGESLF